MPFILILGGENCTKTDKGVIIMEFDIFIKIIELIIILEIIKNIKK